jgi:RhoGEF domain
MFFLCSDSSVETCEAALSLSCAFAVATQIHVKHVDRRTAIAHEILSSESDYCRTLDIIYEVFYVPCKSALESNRAIISLHNLQIIFSDTLQLRDASQ